MQHCNVLLPSPLDTIWQICAVNVTAVFHNNFSHHPVKCNETGVPSAGSRAAMCRSRIPPSLEKP